VAITPDPRRALITAGQRRNPSSGTPHAGTRRRATPAARYRLRQAAADRWGVPVDDLSDEDIREQLCRATVPFVRPVALPDQHEVVPPHLIDVPTGSGSRPIRGMCALETRCLRLGVGLFGARGPQRPKRQRDGGWCRGRSIVRRVVRLSAIATAVARGVRLLAAVAVPIVVVSASSPGSLLSLRSS
jgi:hypothetical protein